MLFASSWLYYHGLVLFASSWSFTLGLMLVLYSWFEALCQLLVISTCFWHFSLIDILTYFVYFLPFTGPIQCICSLCHFLVILHLFNVPMPFFGKTCIYVCHSLATFVYFVCTLPISGHMHVYTLERTVKRDTNTHNSTKI